MKIKLYTLKAMALGLGLTLSLFSMAHTDLSASMPANGAVMHEGPEHVELSFTEEVRLLRVSLHTGSDQEIDLAFRPTSETRTVFAVELPALNPDSYTLEWAVLGEDSHRLEGEINFTVDPGAEMQMGEMHDEEHMDDHEDAH